MSSGRPTSQFMLFLTKSICSSRIVSGLRKFADMVSFLENVTDDAYHSKKIRR